MSGGHFDYDQYRIDHIADSIEQLILTNDDKTLDEWGHPKGRGYSAETILKFRTAFSMLKIARTMAHRIDWLVSDDDGEKTFHKRWDDEIGDLGVILEERVTS